MRTVDILQHLGTQPVEVIYTIFGCWRLELILHPDGSVQHKDGQTRSERTWARTGDRVFFDGPDGVCTALNACEVTSEMRGHWTLGDQAKAKISMAACRGVVADPGPVSIVVASYGQPDWAIANARACQLFNPGARVLVTDDCSPVDVQQAIATAACEYGFDFESSDTNLGHWPGDAKSLRTSIEFARRCGSQVVIRCNQRTVQMKPNWARDLAADMLADDAAVAYQCCWGTPHNIRTELLGLTVARWIPHVDKLHCGQFPLMEPSVWLFENWFHDLLWALFPWYHTAIPWFSRGRWNETTWTVSYYAGCTGKQALEILEGQLHGH